MKAIFMKKYFSEFANLADCYDTARPNYPSKVMEAIRAAISADQPMVLDLGCGTGISTRQLAKQGGMIIGCDIDVNMLTKALYHSQKNVAYVQGQANAIPFNTNTFDAVTAFSALHWFCDDKSLKDIQRVLKPEGIFCAVQRRYLSPYAKDLWEIIEQKFDHKPKRLYSTDKFEDRLAANNFNYTQIPPIKTTVKYSLDQFLILLQSYSIWNDVPEKRRPAIVKYLRQYFEKYLKNGFIHDSYEITVLIAHKK